MKLLTWNILAPMNATQEAFPTVDPMWLSWPRRRDLIISRLRAEAPDIICLQEIDLDADRDLTSALESDYKVWTHYPTKSRTGLMTAVRLPLAEGWILTISDSMRFLKIKIRCVGQQSLNIVNMHLKAGIANEQLRLEQIAELYRTFAPSWSTHPMILTGDMNSECKSAPLNALCIAWDLCESHADRDQLYSSLKVRRDPSGTLQAQARVIDHILFRGIAVSEVKGLLPIAEADLHHGLPNEQQPSDHLPITCTF